MCGSESEWGLLPLAFGEIVIVGTVDFDLSIILESGASFTVSKFSLSSEN